MKKSPEKIAVIGAGSWGTALGLLLGKKGHRVSLWGHRADHVESLVSEQQNLAYLPGFLFPDNLSATGDISQAVDGASVVCMVVPSHTYRQVFEHVLRVSAPDSVFVSATKGIENDSLSRMTQVMQSSSERLSREINCGVLSGPSFAKEVADEVPTAITIGCANEVTARFLQDVFNTDYFRVYTSSDICGLELSAALKNIIAIAAGICDGLGFGTNARAALITRGLAEMTRFGMAYGAKKETFYGLSGLGDLVLTCTGALSRNRLVGLELGRGKKLERILGEMLMIAEGVKTTKSVFDLVRVNRLDMPILEQVHAILYEDKDCLLAVKDLLGRDLKPE